MNIALAFNVRPGEGSSFLADPALASNFQNRKFNDTFAEWDTLETISAIQNALEHFHEVTLVEANSESYIKFKDLNPDIVFNVSEGKNGISREAQIPAMLDMLQIPYTGSDPLTLCTCLDKGRTKEILSYHKIKTPNFIVTHSVDDLSSINLNFPLFVKPNGEGSSKGIFNSSLVYNKNQLLDLVSQQINDYDQPVIIEEYLPGREFTTAILGNDGGTEILPIVELNFDQLPDNLVPVYSFEAKWIFDTPSNPLDIYSCPAVLKPELEQKIKDISLKTYKIFRCKDWSRIDIRLDKYGEPNILEVNPLPGILPDPNDNSCFPKAARTKGLTYEEMINTVLYVAAKRHNLL